MVKIIPSLASADPLRLGECMRMLGTYPYLHLDVEDGNFVPNITFGMKTVRAAADIWKTKGGGRLDVHLMVAKPELWLDELLEAGVHRIAFHLENVPYPAVLLNRIRKGGAEVGVALNCMGCVEQILPYAELADYVLLMTSEPDGRGQMFNPHMVDKIRKARRMLPAGTEIMADGGILESGLRIVADAGADDAVMGRAVWSCPDVLSEIQRLLKQVNGEEGRI